MRRSGYTLIELVLVVLVLTLLVGIVAPRFSGSLPGAKLGRASSELRTVITKLRADTAILARRHQLCFDPKQGTYWALVEQDPIAAPGVFVTPPGTLRRLFRLPEDVRFASIDGALAAPGGTGPCFMFNPDGSVEPGTIVVSLPDGASRTLVLDGATSDVEVLE